MLEKGLEGGLEKGGFSRSAYATGNEVVCFVFSLVYIAPGSADLSAAF